MERQLNSETKRLKISDIAKMAQTSAMTVSRVLNNRPDVSAATRERVLRIIEESGYRPHAFARGLSGKKTRIVGVALYTGGNPVSGFYVDVLQGLQLGLAELDYDLLFFAPTPSDSYYERVTETSIIDGLVLMGNPMTEEEVERIASVNLPVVTIGRRTKDDLVLPFVAPNYRDAFFDIVMYLVAHGAKRVTPLIDPYNHEVGITAPVADRLLGISDAVSSLGLDPANFSEVHTTGKFEDGYSYITGLAELPGAFILDHTDFAFGVVMGLRDRNVKPQKDILLVGVDLHRSMDRCDHVLSTSVPKWTVPWHEAGKRAIRLLRAQMDAEVGHPLHEYLDFISPL